MAETPNALTIAAMEECERMSHDPNAKAFSDADALMCDCERPWQISDLDAISLALLSPEDKAYFSSEITRVQSLISKAGLDHDSDFISDVIERIDLAIALSPSRREFFTKRCADPNKTLAKIQARHDNLLAKERVRLQ